VNFKRLIAISRKELIHIRRDVRSLIFSFIIPFVLLLLFGYALSLDIKNIPFSVLDYDNSKSSRVFINDFSQSGYFDLKGYLNSESELKNTIDSGKSLAVIVIPPDFEKNLKAANKVTVQTIIDGANSNKASIAMGYINAISQSYSAKIITEDKILKELKSPLNSEVRVWYNEKLDSRNYIIPGLIAIIMLIIASLLTSQVISREWENGTMEQLIVSPVKPIELILGKLLPYFIIGMIDLSAIIILGKTLFKVYLRGNILLLFLLSSLFMIGALGMGITISIIAKSQVVSYQLALLTSFLPSYILSGLVFPISSMPKIIKYITYLVPAKYFIIILRGIYLKANTFFILTMDVLYLGVFALLMFIIANFKLVKKLD
jgi:ABC-2 type transport system permease protein